MNIWYDVTGLTHWDRPHLTGIQRSTVGILNGLLAREVPVRLVYFAPRRNAFLPLSVAALPAAVRSHLFGMAEEESAPVRAISEGPARLARKRWFSRKVILGHSPAAADLRVAFRQFKTSSRDLGRQARRWLRARFSKAAPSSLPMPDVTGLPAGTTAPCSAPPPAAPGPFAPGDALVSLGCTWAVPGHATAAAAVRRRGVHLVRMIYDLIPAIRPQWVAREHTSEFVHWARNVLTESDHVLTISEFSKGEIVRYCAECGIVPPPLSIVRLGDVLDTAKRAGAAAPLPRFVPPRPFFVCVSTLDIRKNHRLLYDTWTALAARDPGTCPDLLCIGTPHLYVDDLLHEMRHDRGVNGRIQVLEGIDDQELSWYYANCIATIYPSRYEGWGLPVAESLGHGKLCLASSATSIPEISPLPEFFDPLDRQALVGLVDRAIRDPAWIRERERVIREAHVPTPWTHTAGQVVAAIAAGATPRQEAA